MCTGCVELAGLYRQCLVRLTASRCSIVKKIREILHLQCQILVSLGIVNSDRVKGLQLLGSRSKPVR